MYRRSLQIGNKKIPNLGRGAESQLLLALPATSFSLRQMSGALKPGR